MASFSDGRDARGDADDSLPRLLDEFRHAWEQALDHFTPPSLDWFLQQAGEQSGEIAERLYAVDSEYRNRIGTESRSSEQSPAQNSTVIGPKGDSEADPQAGAFAGTIDWDPPEEEENGLDRAFAATVIGDTANADEDQTDPASGRKDSQKSARKVAGYEILDTLGRGGMGVVYRARQVGLNRLVALKMILGGGHAAPEYLARFQSEAEAVAQLQHPNIVQIYDIGVHEGLPFFSLELIDGQSLEAQRANRPMEPLRSAEITETLARAMGYAHSRGIVHRDLKPANVLLTAAGVPKVTDFGLVKRLEEEDSGQTATGTVMGTPSYMAPEQAWGSKDVGPLADVYSLGAVLYALITGRPPFLGTNAAETVMQLREQEPVPPSRLQPTLPPDLETICLKCLQKEPEKRYANAEELAEDLRRFQANEPILARPVSRAERAWRWCRRNPSLATSGGIAIVLLVCLLIGGPLAALLIDQQRGLAEENARKATKNAGLARQQRDYAVKALNTLVERVPTDLKNVLGTNRIKQNLILTAMNGLEQVETVGGEESKDLVMARAHTKMGESLLEVGLPTDADSQFLQCHAILLRLAKTETETPASTHQLRLGRSFRNLGKAAERLQGAEKAHEFFEKSLKARQAALATAADPLLVNQELADSYGHLGRTALALGRPEEALDDISKSIFHLQEWLSKKPNAADALRQMAGAKSLLGHAQINLGKPAKAVGYFQEALPVLTKLAEQGKADITGQTNLALCYNDLGTAFLLSGELPAAKENCQKAVPMLEDLFRKNGGSANAFLLRKLAKAYYCLGTVCQELNDPEAAKHLERSTTARRILFEKDQKDQSARQDYMLSLARYGQIEKALPHADEVAKIAPQNADALYMLACTYALSAAARERTSQKETETSLPSAEELRKKSVAAIREAVKQGYQATAMLKLDPDLAGVRNDADFQKLLSELNEGKLAGEKVTQKTSGEE